MKEVVSKNTGKTPPFDFNKIKIVIKKSKDKEPEVIFLDRKWSKANIPHFKSVIDGVKTQEGIEITLTCNLEAFQFCVKYLETPEVDRTFLIQTKVTPANCLSIMVTAEFLQLRKVAQHVTKLCFYRSFVEIINGCKLNLTTLNPRLMQDISKGVTYRQIKELRPRQEKDLFVTNLIKLMIDNILTEF